MTMTLMLMVRMLMCAVRSQLVALCGLTLLYGTFLAFAATSRKGKMRVDGKEGKSKDVSVRLPPLLAKVNDTLLVGGEDFGAPL